MTIEEPRRQQFADWLNEQLRQRGWTQGKLILQSGSTDEERLSSAAVSRYSTGKMMPDASSFQKIARAFGVPIELVLQKAGLIEPPSHETDWIQQAIDDLAHAVDAGQLSEEGGLALMAQMRREQRLQQLERQLSLSNEKQQAGPSKDASSE
ncbi:MAG TPA: helix-turn-helix transcriptional regulator [Ktedonobacteraceae bacterium]|nr:helix-turn-helix transcriptional regulator [Ktedonobacteraceae bacterium]